MATLSAREFANLLPDANLLASDEPEMESSLHYWQAMLLVSCLEWLWRDRDDFFIGANLTVYFSHQELKNRDFRGPDFFLVKNTRRQPRQSWVVWEEDGKYPDLIVELLSDSTAEVDRTTKRLLYQDRFRTPEYFWFDPQSFELVGLRLTGNRYQEIPWQQQRLWSEVLELYLGVLDGQLRYWYADGELVPTPQESAARSAEAAVQAQQNADIARQDADIAQQDADIARQDADVARQDADIARQNADVARQDADIARRNEEIAIQKVARLEAKLRELAVDPDDLD
jgi:Uma2 family endonuclease